MAGRLLVVEFLKNVGDVVGSGVLGAVLQESAGLPDGVGRGTRELEHEVFTPVLHRTPRGLRLGTAAQNLSGVAAVAAHERAEYLCSGATFRPLAEGREQLFLDCW